MLSQVTPQPASYYIFLLSVVWKMGHCRWKKGKALCVCKPDIAMVKFRA